MRPTQRKPRILILEDEPIISRTLDMIFRQAGYEVAAFGNGQELLDKAKEFNPDAALLDVVVPGLDGVSAAIRLIAIFPRCKIFLLSGTNDASRFLENAAQQGYHFEVLAKPVPPSELLDRVERALECGQSKVA